MHTRVKLAFPMAIVVVAAYAAQTAEVTANHEALS